MKDESRIRRALQEIASDGVRGHADLWEKIRSDLDGSSGAPAKQKIKFSYRLIIIAALLVLTTAFAFYLFSDPGLQAADNAGLVKHLHQTALPTVFSQVPDQLVPSGVASQTENGITVTLNWAYADELRVAWQLTITGLALPQGSDPGDTICTPYLKTDQGIPLKVESIMDEQVFNDQPGSPREITYVIYKDIDTNRYDHLDIHLDLTIGPCGDWWNFSQASLVPGPTPTPVPLIGNYHLNFSVPVNAGKKNSVDQSVTAGGIEMRLEDITFTPSYTLARLCYQVPQVASLAGDLSWLHTADNWTPELITLTPNKNGNAYNANYFKIVGDQKNESGETCADVGFPVSVDPISSAVVLTVSNLENYESTATILENKSVQKIIAGRLAVRGIEVKFDPEGDNYWDVLKKPEGMTDDEVNQVIREQLKHTVEALWQFEIPVAKQE
jgi:hypothetical protein